MKHTFIIAEAGVNHNGSLVTAKKLIDAAVKAGADAVKFQAFKAESLVSKYAPKAEYQKETTSSAETQLEMLKRLELDKDALAELINYCKKKKITFLSSPFDLESIKLLVELGLRIFKIPSGEITNLPYLKKIGSLNKRVIISTGMASLNEIRTALDVLLRSGTRKNNITILHCNTAYPTPMQDVNLRAMLTIKDRFDIAVGYSDHTLGVYVPVAAVALGASVIEKHFTLDTNMKGPDHKASIEPDQLKEMVTAIRNIEKAIGNGIKMPSPSEIRNREIVRKSIVAARCIKKGEVFNDDDLSFKRPGTGISPAKLREVIGSISKKDFNKDDLIEI